jgi:hypothetical protein
VRISSSPHISGSPVRQLNFLKKQNLPAPRRPDDGCRWLCRERAAKLAEVPGSRPSQPLTPEQEMAAAQARAREVCTAGADCLPACCCGTRCLPPTWWAAHWLAGLQHAQRLCWAGNA